MVFRQFCWALTLTSLILIWLGLLRFYLKCFTFIFGPISILYIVMYFALWIGIHEFTYLFAGAISYNYINYDFETDTVFASKKKLLSYNFHPGFATDEDLIWAALKFRYRDRFLDRYVGLKFYFKKLILKGNFFSRIFLVGARPLAISVIILTATLHLINLVPKVIMTFGYTFYLITKIIWAYTKREGIEVRKLRIYELLSEFTFFKVVLPRNVYDYITTRRILFYRVDLASYDYDIEHWMKFESYNVNNVYKSKHLIWLFIVFDIFVQSYYTAFYRTQALVQLISSTQCMYVVALMEDERRLSSIYDYKDEDYKKMPSFKKRSNPNPFWLRVLLCILFILVEHVRSTAIFLVRLKFTNRWDVRFFYMFGSAVFLDSSRPIRDDINDVLRNIFGNGNTILRNPIYILGYHAQPNDVHAVNDPYAFPQRYKTFVDFNTVKRHAVVVTSSGEVYTRLPTINWYYNAYYYNLTTIEIFFKINWRCLFKDTRDAYRRYSDYIIW